MATAPAKSSLPVPAGAGKAEWLLSYSAWFHHFRAMQPSGLGWRASDASDRWAHEMVSATLLPTWIAMLGKSSVPRFSSLKAEFCAMSSAEPSTR